MEAAESLKAFPQKHAGLPRRPHIRKVAHEAYIIFYKIDEELRVVEILRFWHGARDQRRLRLKEETSASHGGGLAEKAALVHPR
jgi:plasmid stabilization system protein ParE